MDNHNRQGITKVRMRGHWKCVAICIWVSLVSFNLGIDTSTVTSMQAMPGSLQVRQRSFGIESPQVADNSQVFGNEDPQSPIGYNIARSRQQLLAALMPLGNTASGATAGLLSKYIGRKLSLAFGCLVFIAGTATLILTTSVDILFFGRFLLGIGIGNFHVFALLYVQECSPANLRGFLVSCYSIGIVLGNLVGMIVATFSVKLNEKYQYQVPLAVTIPLPATIFLSIFFLPESPRWLLVRNQDEKAMRSLQRIGPSTQPSALTKGELLEIKAAICEEKRQATGSALRDIVRNPVDRRRTTLSVVVELTERATGATWQNMFGTYVFTMAGISDSFEQQVGLSASSLALALLNGTLVTKIGSRRLGLSLGLAICGTCNAVMAIVYTAAPGSRVAVFHASNIGQNGMVMPFSNIAAGEIVSQRLRAVTVGLAYALSSCSGFLTSYTAPYFLNRGALNWGARYAYFWAAACFVSAAWVLIFLPELRDRTFEEIDEMFLARLSARKFRTYQCAGIGITPNVQNKIEHVCHGARDDKDRPSDKSPGLVTLSN